MAESYDGPRVLIARGDQRTISKVVGVLDQFDVELSYIEPEQFSQIDDVMEALRTPGYYHFNEINSPDQWIGREHILSYHRRFTPDVDKKVPTLVYNSLVAPATRSTKTGDRANNRPIPTEHITQSLGLVVRSRKSKDFPPLSKVHYTANTPSESVRRIVNVGSLFSFYALLETNPELTSKLHSLHKPDSTNRRFLEYFINQLGQQVYSDSSRNEADAQQ